MSSANAPPSFAACALHGFAAPWVPSDFVTLVMYAPVSGSRHQYGSGSGFAARWRRTAQQIAQPITMYGLRR